jgi:hypothetical protein
MINDIPSIMWIYCNMSMNVMDRARSMQRCPLSADSFPFNNYFRINLHMVQSRSRPSIFPSSDHKSIINQLPVLLTPRPSPTPPASSHQTPARPCCNLSSPYPLAARNPLLTCETPDRILRTTIILAALSQYPPQPWLPLVFSTSSSPVCRTAICPR